jgi:hypothetical protein
MGQKETNVKNRARKSTSNEIGDVYISPHFRLWESQTNTDYNLLISI